MNFFSKLLLTLPISFLFISSHATHLRCGDISIKRIEGFSYNITLNVYTNLSSPIKFGEGVLSFGDGSPNQITPTQENSNRPDLGSNIGFVSYSIVHQFPKGRFKVTYTEPNLTFGIININNSVERRFYLEALIVVDDNFDSSLPEFSVPPIFKSIINQEYTFSSAAISLQDRSLFYELINPLEPGSEASYLEPELIEVNPYNGLVTWNSKLNGVSLVGEYLFSIRVTQFDQSSKMVGYSARNFQIVLEDDKEDFIITNPIKNDNSLVTVLNNKKLSIKVLLEDKTIVGKSKWSIYYDPIIKGNLTFHQYDSSISSNTARVFTIGAVELTTTQNIVRDNPYVITLRATSASNRSKDINILYSTKEKTLPKIITSIADVTEGHVTSYPNPFNNNFILELKIPYPSSEVLIYNNYGQPVYHTKDGADLVVDTENWPSGIYFIQVNNGVAFYRRKIMKR
jgi:hypothetical protein